MNGNFDGAGALSSDRTRVTVTGWVSWVGTAREPSSCTVTVEVKQTSGPGSADAAGASAKYNEAAPGQRVAWTATTNSSDDDPFHPGPADAEAWIDDSQGKTVFHWPASSPLQLS